MPRAKRRGGRRPGAGRPTTTESKTTPPIQYRVSREERYLIESAAGPATPNEYSKRETLAAARRATGGKIKT
jgi:hypothetical protein